MFLQAGADAARTGVTGQRGPEVDEVAWTVQLPGSRAMFMPPLMLDGQAYVITSDQGFGPSLRANALYRISLATAEPDLLVEFDEPPTGFATDGERFYVTLRGSALAYPRAGGLPVWETAFPRFAPESDGARCAEPALREGMLLLACMDVGRTKTPTGRSVLQLTAFVRAMATESGETIWDWVKRADDEVQPAGPSVELSSPLEVSMSGQSWPMGLSVLEDKVMVTTLSLVGRGGTFEQGIWALDAGRGSVAWSMNNTFCACWPDEPLLSNVLDAPFDLNAGIALPSLGRMSRVATGTPTAAFFHLGLLRAVNVATSEPLWSADIGQEDPVRNFTGATGLGLRGNALFAASFQTLARLDRRNGELAWALTLPPSERSHWGASPLLLDENRVYARSVLNNPPTENVFHAIDAATGSVAWRHAFRDTIADPEPVHFEIALAEGVLVVAGIDGNVTVLGRTPASLAVAVALPEAPPQPGERFALDLGATRAGKFGEATRFRADWGDGTATDWQPSPRLEHAYASEGVYAARLWAGNDAGQTASEFVEVRVGGAAAVPAAADDRLEPTAAPAGAAPAAPFPLLAGVVPVVLLGAAFAVAVVARRRRQSAAGTASDGRVVLGRYRLDRPLARGGSAQTYLATDTVLQRGVVVKMIPGDASQVASLLREARAVAALRHPSIVVIHDVGQAEGAAVLVMEHVEGGALAARLERGPLPRPQFRAVATDLLDALEVVHRAGIVHRDVKTSNVLLTRDGRAKLADFGVAHLPGFETTRGGTGSSAVGTVRFMSPEQARGWRATPRSDLFSAAATLYEALTGLPYLAPRAGESAFEVQLRASSAVAFDRPVPGPPALRAWFARALAPSPDARFASAAEMRRALEQAWGGDAAVTPPRT